MPRLLPPLAALTVVLNLHPARAVDWQVAITGDDTASGSSQAPFRTIQHAADVAQPGDTITVHAGVYRERINPPRGGVAADQRITYRAAPGEHVAIKGSEVARGWTRVGAHTWQLTIPNAFFGAFNPYADLIRGDWFDRQGRDHHTGAVYLNGDWLAEAASRSDVLGAVGKTPLWFADVDATNTTLYAQFKDCDPNIELVEINVRQTVFYPDQPGRNYLTVRGFTLEHAATPWAPPTAEQRGVIGTHWSKGWIIEDNVVRYSACSGITLGKHGDEHDNTSADSAEGYVATIARAHAFVIPWDREHIGSHVVRRNAIAHCEQAGIVGSMGGAFSVIEDNVIRDVHVRRQFTGAEMAGIKLHGAIDTVIRGNRIHHCNRGVWLDWMAQGARVTGNLFYDNSPNEDLFFEVDHGPHLVDNNLFLSPASLLDISQGGAFVHNLFAGRLTTLPDLDRETPHHPAHSTTVAGLTKVRGGDNRFYNNLFIGRPGEPLTDDSAWGKKVRATTAFGLCNYDHSALPVVAAGNVYLNGACAFAGESNAIVAAGAQLVLLESGDHGRLQLTLPVRLSDRPTHQITTGSLGRTVVAKARFEAPDGTDITVDHTFDHKLRDAVHPVPGPFELRGSGTVEVPLW